MCARNVKEESLLDFSLWSLWFVQQAVETQKPVPGRGEARTGLLELRLSRELSDTIV